MISAPRFEMKYLIGAAEYHRLKSAIRPYCRYDPHSMAHADRRYPVRSLYFDSDDFQACVDKHHGLNVRNKLRIRTYATSRDDAPVLKVEQKRRVGRQVFKYVESISVQEYDAFRQSGTWSEDASETLQDFERLIRRQNLSAKLVVEYDREAFVARDGSRARLCFDHAIRYGRTDDLFCPESALRSDLAKWVVFEIKTDRDDTRWLSDLARDHDLKAVPNSKYANAVTSSQASVWF